MSAMIAREEEVVELTAERDYLRELHDAALDGFFRDEKQLGRLDRDFGPKLFYIASKEHPV